MMPTTLLNSDAVTFPSASSAATSTVRDAFPAPSRLVADNRGDFRKAALSYLERAASSGEAARLDLAETEELDASGLGILVLLQKRARELQIQLELVRVPREVRQLLALTKLEHLFRFA